MDPITDVALIGFTGEEIISAASSALAAIEELLGYEGMQAAYDIIHGLGEIELSTILPQITFVNGSATLIGSSLDLDNLGNILAAFTRIGRILFDKGVDLATSSGKELFSSIIEKIQENAGGLTAAAVGTFVGNEVVKYVNQKKEDAESVIDSKLGIRP